MPSVKAIKQRRNVVSNMKQAMKAMNLVATAKLRKAREHMMSISAFLESTDNIMLDAAKSSATIDSIYVKKTEQAHKTTGYIVLTSDRGKCGSYNINVCKAVIDHVSSNGKNALLFLVGSRGMEFFATQSMNIHKSLDSMSEIPTYEEAETIGNHVLEDYHKEIDELFIVYTQYHTVLNLEPVIKPIFPLNLRIENESEYLEPLEMEYDPDVNNFLDYMAPMYLNTHIYGSMLEASLCEQAARMVATDIATNNAQELIENLTLQFNRQRQGIITQEITEIVSGASALT